MLVEEPATVTAVKGFPQTFSILLSHCSLCLKVKMMGMGTRNDEITMSLSLPTPTPSFPSDSDNSFLNISNCGSLKAHFSSVKLGNYIHINKTKYSITLLNNALFINLSINSNGPQRNLFSHQKHTFRGTSLYLYYAFVQLL